MESKKCVDILKTGTVVYLYKTTTEAETITFVYQDYYRFETKFTTGETSTFVFVSESPTVKDLQKALKPYKKELHINICP